MYPRNAVSPERLAIGPVVQISDGAVQTAGIVITYRAQGGAEGVATNAADVGASGTVYYTPTQAEANVTSFVLTAGKTGCIPVAITVVTSASAVPGNAGLDWSKLINPTTANALSATSIASVTGAVGSVTGLTAANLDVAVSTRMATYAQPAGFLAATFPGTVASPTNITAGTIANVTNPVTVGTNNDKTGYALSAGGVTAVQAGLATPTNITAGTITTVTNLTNLPAIPANWLTGTGTDATAVTKIQAGLATPTNITAGTITTVTNLTNAPTSGDLTATMKASVTAAVPTVSQIWTTVLSESYRADGAAGTGAQMLYELIAHMGEVSIAGTVKTTFQVNGSNQAMAFNLNSATAPSTITRVT